MLTDGGDQQKRNRKEQDFTFTEMFNKVSKPENNNDDLMEHLTFTFEEKSPAKLAQVAEVLSEQGSSQQCMRSLREGEEQQENRLETEGTPVFSNEVFQSSFIWKKSIVDSNTALKSPLGRYLRNGSKLSKTKPKRLTIGSKKHQQKELKVA